MDKNRAINIIKSDKVSISDLVFLYDKTLMEHENIALDKMSNVFSGRASEYILTFQHKTQETNKEFNYITFQTYLVGDDSSDKVMSLIVEEKIKKPPSLGEYNPYETKGLLHFSFLLSQYKTVNLGHNIENPKFEYQIHNKDILIKFIERLELGKDFKVKRTIFSYT